MESTKNEGSTQVAKPGKILVQGMVDRDVYYQFKALLNSHKLTTSSGLGWAMRALLTAAGVKVRPDRGMRDQQASQRVDEVREEEAVGK